MSAAITSAEQAANVLDNLRHDLRLRHWHPWIDGAGRRRAVRSYIRDAVARLRDWRVRKARSEAGKAVSA
jgi:hypothetical protein